VLMSPRTVCIVEVCSNNVLFALHLSAVYRLLAPIRNSLSCKFLEMSYESIYVAMSRVRSKEDIWLLVYGDKLEHGLFYVTSLKPNPHTRHGTNVN
jgi:hypothetical protein